MMKMMMVKRSVVTSYRADTGSPSLLSPFVNVYKCCVLSRLCWFIPHAVVIVELVLAVVRALCLLSSLRRFLFLPHYSSCTGLAKFSLVSLCL